MKKKFVILFLFIICVSPIFADLNDGLTAYYPFNGDANDESGNGNDGTVYGATLTTDRFGNENSAYSFNGIDNYIRILRTVQDDFTLGAWIKTTYSLNGSQFYHGRGVIYADVEGSANDFGTSILNEKFTFGNGNPDVTIQSTTSVTTGEWIHVDAVRVKASGAIKIFINGIEENFTNTGNTNSLSAPPNIDIGSNTIDSLYFQGIIDDIYIYNRALNQNEIQELYFNANFTSSQIAYIGEPVQFNDMSTGSPTEWRWDFENDGIYDAFIQNPTHIYNSEGIYSVKLKINNASFVDSLIKEDLITVSYCPPADPDSVEINIIQPDAIISWAEVDTTECGSLITPDGYIVLFSENNEDFFFLTYTTELTYVHSFVAQFSPQMFYKVVAFKNYTKIQINYLKSLNSSKEKIKWSIVKQHLKNKKTSD